MSSNLKYVDIVEWTTKQIATGAFQPKDKFLTEAALCERFGCSRQTVRRALEVLEQRGHVTRIQGSGTYISSGAAQAAGRSAERGGPSMTVGVISTYLDDYIFPSLIRGIEGIFSSEGYAVQLTSTKNLVAGETMALQLMLERRVDGLIVVPTRSALPCGNLDLYRAIMKMSLPLIFIDSSYAELSVPYVALDDEKAGYAATRYLLDMGHREIAGVFNHSLRQGHLRYLGYTKALAEQGIPVSEDRICWYSKEDLQHLLEGEMLWERLSSCTAVLCFNDRVALPIMDLLRQKGRRVPEDLSVVGIDNSKLGQSHSLTSVDHPSEELGEAAAKMLLSMIKGSEGKDILFPARLVERGSVRRLGG